MLGGAGFLPSTVSHESHNVQTHIVLLISVLPVVILRTQSERFELPHL